jgi:hypothetical protein
MGTRRQLLVMVLFMFVLCECGHHYNKTRRRGGAKDKALAHHHPDRDFELGNKGKSKSRLYAERSWKRRESFVPVTKVFADLWQKQRRGGPRETDLRGASRWTW